MKKIKNKQSILSTFTNQRNAICFCGSKKKYKKCHLYIHQGWIKNEDGSWRMPSMDEILGIIGIKKKK